MTSSWKPYVVAQGDYVSKLAHRFGFNAEEVWNDPRNQALRQARPSMDMLAPGDILQIPEAPRKGLPYTPRQKNRYTARVPTVDIVLAFKDEHGGAIADEPYEVRGLGSAGREGRTDGEGRASFTVPVTAREVTIVFPERHFEYSARIGDLDPPSEMSGVRQRLQNLGLISAQPDPHRSEGEVIAEGIARLQAKVGLPSEGRLDDATLKAMIENHGV